MTKKEIYLDLSKLSEVEQDEIFSLLPKSSDLNYKIVSDYIYLHYIFDEWFVDFYSYQVIKKNRNNIRTI